MRKLSILLCIFWMGFIFYMSSFSGVVSNEKSFAIVNKAKNEYKQVIENKQTITANNPKNLPETKKEHAINLFVRKNAHAFEYLLLAILVSNAFFVHRLRGKAALIYIMFVGLLYAVLDEFHQSFVVGRTSLVSDVLIDFSGVLIGIGIYYSVYYKVKGKSKLVGKPPRKGDRLLGK